MGEIDVLICNVRGPFTAVDPLAMSYDALDAVFQLEVVGAFAAAKAVIPAMRERGQGSVLVSSTTGALRGSAQYPLSAIGKFGLRALSQNLAKAYARDGVHVVHFRLDCELDVPYSHAQHPGAVDTDTMSHPDDVAQAYWHAHIQPKSAWSNEIELRPYAEQWTI